MTVPPSYSRHALEFLIHGLRECLEREPHSDMAPRWRKALDRAEAELSELKQMMGETDAARLPSVDRARGYRSGAHVARWPKRKSNR